nr:leucine-rich repeat domain-containing protein [Candidatus Sigynarchaeota archaeon]
MRDDKTISLSEKAPSDIPVDIEGHTYHVYQGKYLDLTSQHLKNPKKMKELENIATLEELDLTDNNLTALDFLEQLENLKKLDLTYNSITDFSGIETLQNLEYLSLSCNDLSQIPDLSNLKNLKKIDLSHNPDISLKDDFTVLDGIEILDLGNCGISAIDNIHKFPSLRE